MRCCYFGCMDHQLGEGILICSDIVNRQLMDVLGYKHLFFFERVYKLVEVWQQILWYNSCVLKSYGQGLATFERVYAWLP